jgi:hypothetical protein
MKSMRYRLFCGIRQIKRRPRRKEVGVQIVYGMDAHALEVVEVGKPGRVEQSSFKFLGDNVFVRLQIDEFGKSRNSFVYSVRKDKGLVMAGELSFAGGRCCPSGNEDRGYR